jgi:transposase
MMVWQSRIITLLSALRAVCLGKKNYIFFGSDHGGERGALLYGLIGTCRLNGIDPEVTFAIS